MTKRAILYVEYQRPECLAVCLSAAKKFKHLNRWDVFVRLDGAPEVVDFSLCKTILPDASFFQEPTHLGNAKMWPKATLDIFRAGYDAIFVAEGDTLQRTDTLDYFSELPMGKVAFYSTLCTPTSPEDFNYYSTGGNYINNRGLFYELTDWLAAGKYVGAENCLDSSKPLDADYWNYDAIYWAWCRDTQRINRHADRHYSLHFGVFGSNFRNESLHKLLFSGDPEKDLQTVLEFHKKQGNEHWMIPPDFVYA